jgi:excisionase family DNA binding protein
MNEPTPPLTLRAHQAARALGISPRLLWQLTRDGVIPHVRIGSGRRKVVLYSVDALKAWLAQQTQVSKEGGGR